MYHSVTFGDKNTWDDWKLIATSRPVINPPKQKTKTVDIPGADGHIELSTSISGYPVFDNRTGSLTFYVDNGYMSWHARLTQISDYLHGRTMRLVLEDEPDYFYEGRFEVDKWASNKDYSQITINYDLKPYKWYITKSTDDWLWDPFSFENGIIQPVIFKNIVVESSTYKEYTFDGDKFMRAPVTPIFNVVSTNGIYCRYVSEDMGVVEQLLPNGSTSDIGCILNGLSDVTIEFKGFGTVSITFRSGRL